MEQFLPILTELMKLQKYQKKVSSSRELINYTELGVETNFPSPVNKRIEMRFKEQKQS